MKFTNYLLVVVACFTLVSCMSASGHYDSVNAARENELSVGTVQKEIRVGMSGAQVAEVLGSPNVVTTDENRNEVWIYDRISTDNVYSSDSGGASLILLGVRSGAGASSKTQKTLTVVIKFDQNKQVRDFSYHSSKF